ncbi:MAG: hypothetical protein HYW80_01735 [Parcubacteria group bacterium]|nr:hypothetical protein [Parcubacteria group bacterium]
MASLSGPPQNRATPALLQAAHLLEQAEERLASSHVDDAVPMLQQVQAALQEEGLTVQLP